MEPTKLLRFSTTGRGSRILFEKFELNVIMQYINKKKKTSLLYGIQEILTDLIVHK